MTEASNIRNYLKLFEAAKDEGGLDRDPSDYIGPVIGSNITYAAEGTTDKITKITASLKSHDSGRYTKLGRNLRRMERIAARMKTLTAEVKQDTRELVADLFHAEDAACTRVVDTVNFVFHMTKDPKASETHKYAKVLEELTEHLTPELVKIMDGLLEKHKSTTQKPPALKATDKQAEPAESIQEGFADSVKGIFSKLKSYVDKWLGNYDNKLAALKAQVGFNESIDEAGDETNTSQYANNDLVRIIKPGSNAEGDYGIVKQVEDGYYEVTVVGTGFFVYCTADELEPATEEQARAYYRQGGPVHESTADNLIDWQKNTGECPDDRMVVDILRRSGKTSQGVRAGSWQWGLDEEDPIDSWQKSDRQLYEFEDEDEDDGFYNGLEIDPSTESFDVHDAVQEASHMLGLANAASDPQSAEQMEDLVRELKNYAHKYSLGQTKDGAVEFNCADSGSVNINYNPMATAWIENGKFYWES